MTWLSQETNLCSSQKREEPGKVLKGCKIIEIIQFYFESIKDYRGWVRLKRVVIMVSKQTDIN